MTAKCRICGGDFVPDPHPGTQGHRVCEACIPALKEEAKALYVRPDGSLPVPPQSRENVIIRAPEGPNR